jgi:hypothetical protein
MYLRLFNQHAKIVDRIHKISLTANGLGLTHSMANKSETPRI